MTLVALETALAQAVIDALTVACLPVAPRPVLYHGPKPADASSCCDRDPEVWVSWSMESGAGRSRASGVGPCGEPPMVAIEVGLWRCWPADPTPDPAIFTDPATYLADAATAGWDGLAALLCDRGWQYRQGARDLRLVSVAPQRNSGGCAGVVWKLTTLLTTS